MIPWINLSVALLSVAFTADLAAQTTAFTYQGELRDFDQPANGLFDLEFTLFDQDSGLQVAGPLMVEDVPVTNGVFTVLLNFGPSPFDGNVLTLGIRVRDGESSGAFETVAPRQVLTSSPYAVKALSAAALAAGGPIDLTIGGVRVARIEPGNGVPNFIGGHPSNLVAGVSGAFLGGGGTGNEPNVIRADYGVIVGGIENQVTGVGGVIGGGQANLAGADAVYIGGGGGNQATNRFAVVSGGYLNLAGAESSTTSGGRENRIHGESTGAVISGGAQNTVHTNSSYAVIGGGFLNQIDGGSGAATISGGFRNYVHSGAEDSTIGGGFQNESETDADFSVIGGGRRNTIQERALHATLAGGAQNLIGLEAWNATISGGTNNTIETRSLGSVIGGGRENRLEADTLSSVIAGGMANRVSGSATFAAVVGGAGNAVDSGSYGHMGGGQFNQLGVSYGVIVGGLGNEIPLGYAGGGHKSFIGGGESNTILGGLSVIIGGSHNFVGYELGHAVIGGGMGNRVASSGATIGGGTSNLIDPSSVYGSIGGGEGNRIGTDGDHAVIAGGWRNEIQGASYGSAIGGGFGNLIMDGARYGAIPGGLSNVAGGAYSFAAGQRAKAFHNGALVWADSTAADFGSSAPDQFLVRASGGVGIGATNPVANLDVRDFNDPAGQRGSLHIGGLLADGVPKMIYFGDGDFVHLGENGLDDTMELRASRFFFKDGAVGIGTDSPSEKLHVVGNILATGTVTGASDRNAKENFAPVDARVVLEKVALLPIRRWNYIGEKTPHLGPVAQDFQGAFQVGIDDKHISMVDADGVALAAIQGLNQKLEDQLREKDAKIANLEREVAELRALVQHALHSSLPGLDHGTSDDPIPSQ